MGRRLDEAGLVRADTYRPHARPPRRSIEAPTLRLDTSMRGGNSLACRIATVPGSGRVDSFSPFLHFSASPCGVPSEAGEAAGKLSEFGPSTPGIQGTQDFQSLLDSRRFCVDVFPFFCPEILSSVI